jgi:hypothetical protein
MRDTQVARRRGAAVGLPKDSHCREAFGNRHRVVSRPIVDDDHLDAGHLLIEHAAQRVADERRGVETGNDYADRDGRRVQHQTCRRSAWSLSTYRSVCRSRIASLLR